MEIKIIEYDFSVCKVADTTQIVWTDEFCFVGKTDEELSLVCLTAHVPANAIIAEHGWLCFRIQGVLDFSLVGILANISALLADNGISIFAVSTYNTDYILVSEASWEAAITALKNAGYAVV